MKSKVILALLSLGLALCLKCSVHAQTCTPKTFTASTVGSTVTELGGSVPASNTMTFLANGHGCGGCQAPTNGTITSFSQDTGTLVYKPTAGFIGTDSFTYLVHAQGANTGDSAQCTINVVVTNAKTTVTAKLSDLGVLAITGKVALVMGQVLDSPTSIIPGTKTVVATLDGTGRFTTSVYPSVALFPTSAYTLVYIDAVTLRQEKIGLYNIPASTATIDLSTCNCRVIDAASDAKLSFATRAALDALITQVQSFDVLDNGTPAATRRVLNFIPGSGMTSSVVDNSVDNRVDVTISCASCTGGSLASGTTGRPLVYTSTTVAGGAAFTGAHRLWTSNASNNAMEFKAIACSGSVACTSTPGQLAIVGSAVNFTLNTQTGTSQTLNVVFTGSTAPTWNSAANVHNLILPDAAANVTHGLVTNGTQSFSGSKLFESTDGLALTVRSGVSGGSSVPIQRWDTFNGVTTAAMYADDVITQNGLWAVGLGVGNGLTVPSTIGTGVISLNHSAGAVALTGFGATVTSTQGSTGVQRGLYLKRVLDGSGNYSNTRNATITGELTWSGSATLPKGAVFRADFTSEDTGVCTECNGFASYATFNGLVGAWAGLRAAAPVNGSNAGIIYGVLIEDQIGAATNNFGIYTNAGLNSFGDRVDIRGVAAANVSNAAEARWWMDSNTNILKLSVNGGLFGQVENPLTGSGTLDFPSISANSCATELTFTVTGAVAGKPVWLGVPTASVLSGVVFSARVSATDTVSVGACNVTGSSKDPASGSFSVRVSQ